MYFSESKNEKLPENFYLNLKFVSSFKHLVHIFSSRACFSSTDMIFKDIKCKTNGKILLLWILKLNYLIFFVAYIMVQYCAILTN